MKSQLRLKNPEYISGEELLEYLLLHHLGNSDKIELVWAEGLALSCQDEDAESNICPYYFSGTNGQLFG